MRHPQCEASPVSRYTVTPTSLPIASATTGHYLPRASVAGVRSAPAQLMVYGQQRPPGNAYLKQKKNYSAAHLSVALQDLVLAPRLEVTFLVWRLLITLTTTRPVAAVLKEKVLLK